MSVWFGASLPPEYPFPKHDPGAPKQESVSPPIPVIYETTELDKMSLRVYSAIHLREQPFWRSPRYASRGQLCRSTTSPSAARA